MSAEANFGGALYIQTEPSNADVKVLGKTANVNTRNEPTYLRIATNRGTAGELTGSYHQTPASISSSRVNGWFVALLVEPFGFPLDSLGNVRSGLPLGGQGRSGRGPERTTTQKSHPKAGGSFLLYSTGNAPVHH